MAKDKNKTGRTPQNDVTSRDRRSKSEPGISPKPAGSDGMKQKGDVDRDSEGRFTNDTDAGTPKGGATRGNQMTSPDRNSQRIDDDDDVEDDMDSRAGYPKGAPRYR